MVPLLPPFRVQAFSHSSEDRTRIASAPKTDRRLQAMADNPLHQRNADELTRSDVVLNMERSIIAKCGDGNEDLRCPNLTAKTGVRVSPWERQ